MIETGDIAAGDFALHSLNRLGFGPRPGDLERVRKLGADEWINRQLHPESIPIPNELIERIRRFHTLHMTPVALFTEFQRPIRMAPKGDMEAKKAARMRARIVISEGVEARLLRALEGPRQLQEVMTAFWFNHFNVFAAKGLCAIWTPSFEETAIRPHTMGRFRDLLGATARHPAMLFYLDNWQNTAPGSAGARGKFDGINENYARELMELHTLGVNGGYTQADVIALAHVLTGWGLARAGGPSRGGALMGPRMGRFGIRRGFHPFRPANPGIGNGSAFYFDSNRHDRSDKILLGERIHGGGEEEVERALDLLARHPATAKHLSLQLAQHFVSDNPPPALVERLSRRYLETDGDIRSVLAAIFESAEFRDRRNFRSKFKTPYEYVISSVRACGVEVRNFRPMAGTMQLLGMPLYGCQTPNGYADAEDAWLNPDAMMTRLSFAAALGSGNLPLLEAAPEPGTAAANRGYFNRAGRANLSLAPKPANRPKMTPPDDAAIAAELARSLSRNTEAAIESAPKPLRAAMLLGSPEFMMR